MAATDISSQQKSNFIPTLNSAAKIADGMKTYIRSLAYLLVIFVTIIPARSQSNAAMPSDTEIRQILVDRIDTYHQGVGIVVGVIDPSGRRVIAYGKSDKDAALTLDGKTEFEIGSMTKVFTSLILSDMVQHGEVALDDPVAKYLPAGVKVPERGGRSITLVDLATHTSGLPRMPGNFAPKDPGNPYADYSVDQLYRFLSSYQLTRDIGSQFEYSNLGVGLLGIALSRRANTDYETLVKTRICDVLGMNDTRIQLSPDMKSRLAIGHGADLKPVENWDLPTFAGAGALRSTANDMLTFLAANLGYTKSSLSPDMAQQLKVRRPAENLQTQIALGWLITSRNGHQIMWHNGGTGGYRSYMGFDPDRHVGVVVLSNTSNELGVDDIGMHLLDSQIPLWTQPKEAAVDPKIYDGYTGRYQMTAPNIFFNVFRDGSHLLVQLTGQSRFEAFPKDEKNFFLKVVNAQITFETDAQGHATDLILHQGGIDQKAVRIGDAPELPKEVIVDPKILDSYVGQYQLAPNFILTVTREGDHLFTQATGQSKVEVYAQDAKNFFLKVVDAQISFQVDAQGHVTGLILHQTGDHPAKRMP